MNAIVNFCDIAESVTNVNKNIESENLWKHSKEITKEMADQPELLLEAEASDLGTKE